MCEVSGDVYRRIKVSCSEKKKRKKNFFKNFIKKKKKKKKQLLFFFEKKKKKKKKKKKPVGIKTDTLTCSFFSFYALLFVPSLSLNKKIKYNYVAYYKCFIFYYHFLHRKIEVHRRKWANQNN